MLQTQQRRSWHDIVTLGESWFDLSTDHERRWLAPGEASPDQERHTIQSPQFMLTIVWGVTEFHVVKLLPKGATLDASYNTDEILSKISSWREAQGGSANRSLVIHAENARPHPAGRTLRAIEACGMVRASHLPSSPDLAPSHFFLFGDLKRILQGRHFETWNEFFAAIIGLMDAIEEIIFEKVFPE
jgi:hypothetical protein